MLNDWISQQIITNGPVPFARFMEWALYHPEWGYYSRGPSIGPRGDFTTSPEASPAFGAMLARHVINVDAIVGHPEPLTILECGPGRGSLASDILTTLRTEHPSAYRRVQYVLLEISDALRRSQEATLAAAQHGNVRWIRDLAEYSKKWRGTVIGNEFLDAFPVHVISRQTGEVVEEFVGVDGNGRLSAHYRSPSSAALTEFLEHYAIDLGEGERIEVSLAASDWLIRLGRMDWEGVATFIDYGDLQPVRYSKGRREGTLLGYRGGSVSDDPLEFPGEQDLTALVDFTHMSDAARQSGFDLLGITRQATFLVGLGLGEGRATPLSQRGVGEALAYRKGLQTLISMEGLGRFHVMVLSKGLDADLARRRLSGLRYIGVL